MSISREYLETAGIPWPEPEPGMGGHRFSTCLSFHHESNNQVMHRLPPSPPSRRAATAWDTYIDDDGDEHEIETEWRELDDEEWAAALAAHEADKKRGTVFVVKGCAVESAEFVMENGGRAKGVLTGGKWHWTEWSTP